MFGFFRRAKKGVNKHRQRINLTLPRLKFTSEHFCTAPKKVQFLSSFLSNSAFEDVDRVDRLMPTQNLRQCPSSQAANITKQNIGICTFLFILVVKLLLNWRKKGPYVMSSCGIPPGNEQKMFAIYNVLLRKYLCLKIHANQIFLER